MSKLALGTAQFGIDYGINNVRGKIPRDEVFAILDEAFNNGVDTLDTAGAYGDSETTIGEYIKNSGRSFKIVSKLPKCSALEVQNIVSSSLEKLNVGNFYGYLIHNFKHFLSDPGILNVLEKLKSEGKINKIGFSLYYPHELEQIIDNNIKIDIVQLPFNVFDQRFAKYFTILKKLGIEVHLRSVFLQGLFFKNNGELDGCFSSVKGKISRLHELSAISTIPLSSILINFALLHDDVDRVVAGVDNIQNLRELINSVQYSDDCAKLISKLGGLKEEDEQIILPFNWKLEAVK